MAAAKAISAAGSRGQQHHALGIRDRERRRVRRRGRINTQAAGLVRRGLRRRRLGYQLRRTPGKLYRPVWQYNYKVLAKDLSAHLIYGLTTATAFKEASRRNLVKGRK
jgi:hypothetical protein